VTAPVGAGHGTRDIDHAGIVHALQDLALVQTQGNASLLYAALDRALAQAIGHTLFTILSYDPLTRESARIYSNLPVPYPTGAKKPLAGGPWVEIVLERGEAFIGRNREDLASVFADHELIASLGCESVLNVPVRWRGQTLASLNLLHTQNWYRQDQVPLARAFAQAVLPALLDPPTD
jgi:hypothetical protein